MVHWHIMLCNRVYLGHFLLSGSSVRIPVYMCIFRTHIFKFIQTDEYNKTIKWIVLNLLRIHDERTICDLLESTSLLTYIHAFKMNAMLLYSFLIIVEAIWCSGELAMQTLHLFLPTRRKFFYGCKKKWLETKNFHAMSCRAWWKLSVPISKNLIQ